MRCSFEVFPPRKEEDTPKLHEAILRLTELEPNFISVTFGAGGSRTRGSLSVLKFIRDNLGASPLAHLNCVGTTEQDARELVQEFLGKGITDFLLFAETCRRERAKCHRAPSRELMSL